MGLTAPKVTKSHCFFFATLSVSGFLAENDLCKEVRTLFGHLQMSRCWMSGLYLFDIWPFLWFLVGYGYVSMYVIVLYYLTRSSVLLHSWVEIPRFCPFLASYIPLLSFTQKKEHLRHPGLIQTLLGLIIPDHIYLKLYCQ